MLTNASKDELFKALHLVNLKYEGNVTFATMQEEGKRMRFTLKVVDCHGPGHRRGQTIVTKDGRGKCLSFACWHVHGHFFEALFKVKEDAWVLSGTNRAGPMKITRTKGNWKNWNIGSEYQPLMFSEACDCHS